MTSFEAETMCGEAEEILASMRRLESAYHLPIQQNVQFLEK